MGKPAGRLGDIGSEHNGFPPTPVISGSPDVSINGKPAARVGDALAPHSKPKNGSHGRALAAGANSVLINGKPAARMGSAISCGGTLINGSNDVSIGDNAFLNKPSNASLPDIDFPNQHGVIFPKNGRPIHISEILSASDPVLVDVKPSPNQDKAPEPEYKDLIIRIKANPEYAADNDDIFLLTSTDGSYSATRTMQDDMIPGDDYIDLLYEALDTSLHYTLVRQEEGSRREFTYFEDQPYYSLSGLS